MLTRQALIIATIRTAMPSAVGALLAWLISRIPAVADIINTLDVILAQAFPDAPALTVTALLSAAAVGVVSAAYYWLARELGRRWPVVERFLLGSSRQPMYATPEAEIGGKTADLPEPPKATREQYQFALKSRSRR